MSWFTRLSLAQRFSLLSFILIFGAIFLVAAWTGQQIENGVLNRTAALTALYVDSLVTHHLQGLPQDGLPGPEHVEEIDSVLRDSPIGQSLAAYKIWAGDGHIVYSSEPALVGMQFPVDGALQEAFAGTVSTEISNLDGPADAYERQRWSRLIETYAPLRAQPGGQVIGAIEFYQPVDTLAAQISAAQQRSWLALGALALVIYVLLARLIFGASHTISRQQDELREKVAQLTSLLAQNEQLHSRVSRAAARTAALNERFLSRISADLHDGPGQDLALALLRIDELSAFCNSCRVALRAKGGPADDFRIIRSALNSALTDLRSTLAGLRLPEIEQLSPGRTAERAVHDFEQKTGARVGFTRGMLPDEASLSVKITLYRLLQEALSNGFRHADGAAQRVVLDAGAGMLLIEVSDSGGGFDPQAVEADGLGLAVMRERVEILGGLFEIQSEPGQGTVIRASLPVDVQEEGVD